MKKIKFYSLVFEKYQTVAKLQIGWTDGNFNYYRDSYGWYAIVPNIGLSLCWGNTRKECEERANSKETLELLNKKINSDMADRFNYLVNIAKKEAEKRAQDEKL